MPPIDEVMQLRRHNDLARLVLGLAVPSLMKLNHAFFRELVGL